MFDKLHEDAPWHDGKFRVFAEKFSPRTPWHVKDGLTIYLAETNEQPWDEFTTEKHASPWESVVGAQALDDDAESGDRGNHGQ